MSLDDVILEVRKSEHAAFMRGDAHIYTVMMYARMKLVEARDLADHLTDFEDMEGTDTWDMATNFLSGGIHHE